ncbi:hypothetical protein EHO58_05520 [Leptospira selangorensis]|uniref:hypothetical protein n=1 Tax=Leptospira selangorensis TaxID=2484982 RepID=UPI001082B603|nr:hypothetical protein [Leptospira selangorensis]TGK08634.1 hypothetical protein EHO58_05520 [Leptospira selangorensis]
MLKYSLDSLQLFYLHGKVYFNRAIKFITQNKGVLIPLSVIFFLGLPLLKYCFLDVEIKTKYIIIDAILSGLSPLIATLIIERKSIWSDMGPDLKAELAKTKEKLAISENDKNELQHLVEKFFNDAKFTKKGISDLFKFNSKEYFCVMKSSENLDLLFQKKKKIGSDLKFTQIPLGKVLNDHPKRIKPFGNMDIYFFPYSVLKGFNNNIQKWMAKEILPKVRVERDAYVQKFGKKLNLSTFEISELKKDSYVYLGFELNARNIAFDLKGKSLNDDLFEIIKGSNDQLLSFTSEITEAVKSSDLFLRVEWNTIIELSNKKQLQDLNYFAEAITAGLKAHGVESIASMAIMNEQVLAEILFKILKKRQWTLKVCINKARLIIASIGNLLNTLRKAKVKI